MGVEEMNSEFHFGPARSGEATVYGARTPGSSLSSILEWSRFMRRRGVTRVCCLLDPEQLADFSVDLEVEYKKQFGADNVLMWPVDDHHLCSQQALTESILPFLRMAELRGERVVVHCWGGNGRAGHVLAAWLVAARGMAPREALDAVQDAGRLPQEAVLAGNATMDELIGLLAACRTDQRAD
jgi:protein-tyrosine phosphatase